MAKAYFILVLFYMLGSMVLFPRGEGVGGGGLQRATRSVLSMYSASRLSGQLSFDLALFPLWQLSRENIFEKH